VGDEDNPFVGFRCRHSFPRREPACHALRNSPGGGDPGYIGRGDLRPLPAGAPLKLCWVILPRGGGAGHARGCHLDGRDKAREPESRDVSPIHAREKREVSLSGIQLSQMLAGTEDLPSQLKQETNKGKTSKEEHL
jgi:hypothetical protein